MSIKMFIGPMFSSKTTRMYEELERYKLTKKRCIIVKHTSDNRYSDILDTIITNSGRQYNNIEVVVSDSLSIIEDKLNGYDVIGVDELQFFDDCINVIQRLSNKGKIIITAGLDATFECKPFNNVCGLIPYAEDVIKLKAVCTACYSDASFTYRTSDDVDTIVVGGADMYTVLCRSCRFY